MQALLVAPAILQAAAMAVDEGWFHRRRGLPRWERVGHPVDTLSVALCYAWLVVAAPSSTNLIVFAALAAFSCLVVTKDEWVHARLCSPGEQWLHAVLFVLHPIVFAGFAAIWWSGRNPEVLVAQLTLTAAFGTYQLLYWSAPWKLVNKPDADR